MEDNLRIVGLEVTNVKRIKVVRVRPEGNLIIIGGDNEQGKTSLLDAIEMTLGGGKRIPAEPLRRGAESGESVVDLGDVLVTRTFLRSGGGSLRVEAKMPDGSTAAIASPQTWLDKRIASLSFDPLAFFRLGKEEPKKAADMMRAVVGCDTSGIDLRRKVAFENRTTVNRDLRDAEGEEKNLPWYPTAGSAPVSVAALTEALKAAQATNRRKEDAQKRRDACVQCEKDSREKVERLRRELADEEAALVRFSEMTQEAERDFAALPEEDESSILTRMEEAEAVNARVAANAAKTAARKKVEDLREKSSALTRAIEQADSEKAALLAATKFPVPGLGFGEDGLITLNGLPLEQASGAERIRVSMAVAMEQNPTLRVVLIRDGSLLDGHSLAVIAEMAKERDAQVWMERVGDGDLGAVVIEDGTVARVVGKTFAGEEG